MLFSVVFKVGGETLLLLNLISGLMHSVYFYPITSI